MYGIKKWSKLLNLERKRLNNLKQNCFRQTPSYLVALLLMDNGRYYSKLLLKGILGSKLDFTILNTLVYVNSCTGASIDDWSSNFFGAKFNFLIITYLSMCNVSKILTFYYWLISRFESWEYEKYILNTTL